MGLEMVEFIEQQIQRFSTIPEFCGLVFVFVFICLFCCSISEMDSASQLQLQLAND